MSHVIQEANSPSLDVGRCWHLSKTNSDDSQSFVKNSDILPLYFTT